MSCEIRYDHKVCNEHTVLLHDAQHLDDNLGAGPNEDLTLASLLGVVYAFERIIENRGSNHARGCETRFSRRKTA